MDLDLVFNELSGNQLAQDARNARRLMTGLIDTIRFARRNGARLLRIPEDFHAMPLAPNYSLALWLQDREASREERTFLRTLATKSPFLAGLESTLIEDRVLSCDFLCGGTRANGLGVAFALDSIGLSFLSEARWDTDSVELEIISLDNDNKFITKSDCVTHASKLEHIRTHLPWIKKRLRQGISSGLDVWNLRGELFPCLQFCDSVQKQLEGLAVNNPLLPQIVRHLSHLNDYCANWTDGQFRPNLITSKGISVESQVTLQQYSAERTFECPDGQHRRFNWHSKIGLYAWRIYFYEIPPDADRVNGQMIIGYIGQHLRTASDPS